MLIKIEGFGRRRLEALISEIAKGGWRGAPQDALDQFNDILSGLNDEEKDILNKIEKLETILWEDYSGYKAPNELFSELTRLYSYIAE